MLGKGSKGETDMEWLIGSTLAILWAGLTAHKLHKFVQYWGGTTRQSISNADALDAASDRWTDKSEAEEDPLCV